MLFLKRICSAHTGERLLLPDTDRDVESMGISTVLDYDRWE